MRAETTFGKWLKQRRKALDLTQAELARRIGCTASLLQKVESGERRPTRQIAELLADALGIDADKRPAFLDFARLGGRAPDWLRPPANLPAPVTPLIGRDQDAGALRKRLLRDDTRLVTLLGPPGIGKTRLSLHIAADVRDRFDDGVFFVELAPVTDPDLVAPTLARALWLKETGARPPLDLVSDYLRDKIVLLVLDNFEQVIAAAPLVAKLLGACPMLKALATSRFPLRIRAERQFPVAPLTVPDPTRLPPAGRLADYPAVALFVDRAQAVQPDFTVTPVNAEAVARICHRLDGLPLAIELIASRVKMMTPQALLDRLGGRLLLQSDGLRDVDERQRTLENAIAWSFNLLTPDEQALFARLAIFAGGWTLEAAEAVAGERVSAPTGSRAASDTLDRLTSLVNKSLVSRQEHGSEVRFSMLEMIREYAAERLEAGGETETWRQRHAEYFVTLAKTAEARLTGTEQTAWLNRLERERDNLRAVLKWSLASSRADIAVQLSAALWRFWEARGYLNEGREWIERALASGDAARDVSAIARAKALQGAGTLASRQGDLERAVKLHESALDLFREAGDKRRTADLLNSLGDTALNRGNAAQARAYFEESLPLLKDLGDQRDVAFLLIALGHTALAEDDRALAQSRFEESLNLLRQLEHRWGIANALIGLGEVARIQRRYEQAAALYQESLTLLKQMGHRGAMSTILASQGYVAQALGDHTQASALLRDSLALAREIEHKPGIANCLAGLAGVSVAVGQPERSARLLGAAQALLDSIGIVLWPADRAAFERVKAHAQAELDPSAFDAAWAHGCALTLDQAIADALRADPAAS